MVITNVPGTIPTQAHRVQYNGGKYFGSDAFNAVFLWLIYSPQNNRYSHAVANVRTVLVLFLSDCVKYFATQIQLEASGGIGDVRPCLCLFLDDTMCG